MTIKYENEPDELSADDIKPRLAVQGRKLILKWTCPRCNFNNATIMPVEYLIKYYNEIRCQNTEICGDRSVWFDVNLSISEGFQISLTDIPLVKEIE